MTFSYTESDFDKEFFGQLEVVQLDDYGTPKNGTTKIYYMVRSIVNKEKGTVTLVSCPPKYMTDKRISMDGTVGLSMRILDKYRDGTTSTNVPLFHMHHLLSKEVLPKKEPIPGEDHMYKITVDIECDDIVYNQNGEYTFPLTIFCKGKFPYMYGTETVIPIAKFNHLIRMRDIYYTDYKGCSRIEPDDD